MKVDFNTELRDHKGEAIIIDNMQRTLPPEERTPATVGAVAMEALLAPERDLKPSELLKRFKLANKVEKALKNGGAAELKSQDISKIKDSIARVYSSPLIYGLCCSELDPAEAADEDDEEEPKSG